MKVSKLDKNNDWTFGRGFANYANASSAIAQNIQTRIKSFKRDWYLDSDANIDWLTLLGTRGIKIETIRQQVERTVQQTDGVARVDEINLNLNRATRELTLTINVVDIYHTNLLIEDLAI